METRDRLQDMLYEVAVWCRLKNGSTLGDVFEAAERADAYSRGFHDLRSVGEYSEAAVLDRELVAFVAGQILRSLARNLGAKCNPTE